MTTGLDPFEHTDAAYVLGALSHEDRVAYGEHLRTCARCSAAVAQLAALPGLLARLPGLPGSTDPAEQPPDTVLPGLLARMRRSRFRRRAAGATAGLAAAALLVGGTAVVAGQGNPAPEAPGVPVALVGGGDVPVHARLILEDVAWGTRITMTCRYDGPPPTGAYDRPRTYQLVVVPTNDRGTQSVAQWRALPGQEATVAGSTELSTAEIAEVELRDSTGAVLLEGSPGR